MELNVSQIDEVDGLDVEHLYAEGEPGLEEEGSRLTGHTALKLHAWRDGEEVLLRGNVKATVEFECDRCLAVFDEKIARNFDLLYLPVDEHRLAQEEHELTEDDLSIGYYQGHFINLDDLVREQIELALPMTRLCQEDCRGLCQYCGANLNEAQCGCVDTQTDPRWDALKGLKLN